MRELTADEWVIVRLLAVIARDPRCLQAFSRHAELNHVLIYMRSKLGPGGLIDAMRRIE